MNPKAILMFQDLIGGRKKSISPVKYFTNLEGALGLISNTAPENKCSRRSCREVSIALEGYWAVTQGNTSMSRAKKNTISVFTNDRRLVTF